MLSCRVALTSLSLCIFLTTGCGVSNPPVSTVPSPSTPSPSTGNQWTWVAGSNLANQQGSYGQQGIPASSNAPPARYGAATWTDAAGNLWLFGGMTAPTSSSDTYFNDLWKFSGGQWTWVSGSNTPNVRGVYGTLGVLAASNMPGGRTNAVSWTDNSGNVWLFGGAGLDANGRGEDLNDLWRYSNGQWTWMGGPQTTITGTPGIYGVKGIAAAGNIPGGRADSMGWTDTAGNFWLFGGLGEDSVGNWGFLNDLWKYSNGQWTWVGGTNIVQQAGVYGTMGVPAAANTPGGREDSATWVDASGNLWLFGGGYNQPLGTLHELNDLWKYSNGQWTWMGGSDQPDQPPVYGTQGVAAPANNPGSRACASSWVDGSGNFWLFGGGRGWPNDLWKYSNGQWTWVGGSQASSPGTYGTLGSSSGTNIPGSRLWAAAWIDHSGQMWLFGGQGNDSTGTSTSGYLNDLWMYQP
jgi:N-acetylneuraminic acid mutarotase